MDLKPEFWNFALAALKELAKKFPAVNPSIGKKKGKKFKKIRGKKHLSDQSHVDGDVPSKLRRSLSDGSAGECSELGDTIDAEEEVSEEIFVQENVDSLDKSDSDN